MLSALMLTALLSVEPPTEHRVDVALGYADLSLVDEAASRLPYHSPGAHLRLRYVGEREHLRWMTVLDTRVGPLSATGLGQRTIGFASIDPLDGAVDEVRVPMRGRMIAPGVELGVQGKWRLGTSDVTLLAGASLTWDVAYPTGFATPGLMQLLALQPTLTVRADPHPKHRFESTVSTTLGAWTTRMAYHQSVSLPNHGRVAGLFAQGSCIQSLDTLQTLRVAASYAYRITPRWSIEARYQLRWLHQAEPRDLHSLEHIALLGFSFHV